MSSSQRQVAPPAYSQSPAVASIGYLIFASRWLQVPLYLGLIVAQCVYVWQFMLELWHLVTGVMSPDHALDEAGVMLIVLGLVDVIMIANLLIMVIIGGYETFVSRINVAEHPDQPEWLSHVNANVLKVKLAMAIIGISSIHLLRTFIESNSGRMSAQTMYVQVVIHLSFVLSAMALAWIDRISHRPDPAPAAAAPVPTGAS